VTVASNELAKAQVRGSLVAIRQGMIPDEVRAEDRRLRAEVRVRLNTEKPRLRGKERRLCQADPLEPGDSARLDPEDFLRDQKEVDEVEILNVSY